MFLHLSIFLLLGISAGFILYFYKVNGAAAEWYNDNYSYRLPVTITNSSGSDQTNLETSFTIDTSALITAGKLQSDCDDIRVTGVNGTLLKHWVQSGSCNTTTTKIWAKVESIPTSGATIYAYYGNPNATNIEKPEDIFSFYEGFSGSDVNKNIWVITSAGTQTQVYVNNGELTLVQPSGSTGSLSLDNLSSYDATNYKLVSRANFGTDAGLGDFSNRWVGWQGSGGNRILFYKNRDNADLYAYSAAASFSSSNYTGTWGDTYHVYTMWKDTNSMFDIDDGAFTGNIGTNVPGGTHFKFSILNSTFGGSLPSARTVNIDFLFIYKRVSVTTSVGNEQQSNTPIAYWKFDESGGTNTYDSSGNGYTGTLGTGASAPTWAPSSMCVSNGCLQFDGSMDYVTVAENNIGKLTSSFSVSAWIKSNDLTGTHRIIGHGRQATANGFGFATFGTGLRFTTFGVKDYDSTRIALEENKWYNVAAVMDNSSDVTFYLNGQAVETVTHTTPGNANTDDVFYIGRTYYTTAGSAPEFFNGFIDEVKIYPYIRTAAQIKQDYVKGAASAGSGVVLGQQDNTKINDGLVGYWKLDETVSGECQWYDGNTLNLDDSCDNTGNKNMGVWTGNTAGTTGKYGNGLQFDGTGDYVTFTPVTFTKDSGSVCFWAKTNSTGDNTLVFTYTPSQLYRYLRFTSAGISIETNTNGDVYSYAFTRDTNWNHYCLTMGSNQSVLYMNGEQVATNSPLADNISFQYFGRELSNATYGNGYYGLLDEVRFYNRTLSASEVKQLYNFAPGPIGYWDFNENTGLTANDKSGNGYTGTLTNMEGTEWKPGKFGSGLNFDSVNKYIDIASSVPIDSEWTISAWSEFPLNTSPASYNTMVRAGGSRHHVLVQKSTGELGTYNNAFYTSTYNTNSLTGWHYVTAVGIGSSTVFYMDGVKVGASASKLTDDVKHIGGISGADQSWGKLDDLKVYNYVRTPQQIIEDMNASHPAPGSPVGSATGHWKFDEGYGIAANDSSTNGNIGVFTTASSGPTWTNNGKFGKALSFDGNDTVCIDSNNDSTCDDSSSLKITNNLTISAWINKGTGGAYGHPVRKGNAYFLTSPSNETLEVGIYIGGTPYTARSTETFAEGEWVHMVGTYDGSNLKIYGNGKLLATTPVTGNIADVSSVLQIGSYSGSSNFFYGLIDEVKIYNSALTAEQVKAEYNQGKAQVLGYTSTASDGTTPSNSASREYCVPGDTSTCNAPLGEWKLDENTGAVAYDRSGNGNNGNITAGKWSPGKYGSAFEPITTNSQDMITVSDPSSGILDFSNAQDFTFSFWYKHKSTGDAYIVPFYKGASANNIAGYDFEITVASGDSRCKYTDGDGTANDGPTYSAAPFMDGNWYFISCVMDRSGTATGTAGYHMFVNGVLEASDTSLTEGSAAAGSQNLVIGEMNTTYDSTFAIIDDVKIYNYSRTRAQIAWEYNRGAPIAWYRFDECQGSTAYNAALNGNGDAAGSNGTITIGSIDENTSLGTCNSGTTTEAWNNGTMGKRNASLDFDGSDDYVSISNPSYDDFGTGPMSVSAWVKTSRTISAAAPLMIVDNKTGGTNNAGFNLQIDETGKPFFRVANATTQTNVGAGTATDIDDGNWHHLVGVLTRSPSPKIDLYIDGAFQLTGTTAGLETWNITSAQSMMIAAYGTSRSNGNFPGQIDDIQIFNYDLTPLQVKNIMNAGAIGFR